MTTSFVDALRAAADDAAATETTFRREAAQRIAELERERAFAFRRLNLMRAIADAVSRAGDAETAVSDGVAIVRARLDWSSENEAQSAVLSHFTPVARSLFASLNPDEESDGSHAAEALAGFETWYATMHGSPFWSLLDEYMAETPRVDF